MAGSLRAFARQAPVPHEHGAWVILYAPLVMALAAGGPFRLAPSLLLLLAVTGFYLARNAASLLIRRRAERRVAAWLTAYASLGALGGFPLLVVYHRWALLPVGALAAALFAAHGVLGAWPARKRLDRSKWGEVLGVFALALTGPGAFAVSRNALGPDAWRVWAACALYFSSAIFHVKMLLDAAKSKRELTPADRLRIGRDNLLYTAVMSVGAAALGIWLGGTAGALAVAAFLPGVARSLWRNATLSRRLPKLKRIGWQETVISVWFLAAFVAALRLAR